MYLLGTLCAYKVSSDLRRGMLWHLHGLTALAVLQWTGMPFCWNTSIKAPACTRQTDRQRCFLQSWGGWHADASTTAAPDRHTLNQTPAMGLNLQHPNSSACPLHILQLAPGGKFAHVLMYTGCSAITPLLPKFMPLKRPTSLKVHGQTPAHDSAFLSD